MSRVSEILLGAASGACFLTAAWWMRTHEFWSTRNARHLAEEKPSAFRAANYRAEVIGMTVVVPLGLAGVGIALLITALWRL